MTPSFRPWFFDVESGIDGRRCGSYADCLRDLSCELEGEMESAVQCAENDHEAKEAVNDFESANNIIQHEICLCDDWRDNRKVAPDNERFWVLYAGRTYFIDTPLTILCNYRATPLIGAIIDGKEVRNIGGYNSASERIDFTDGTAKWLTFAEIDQMLMMVQS